MLYNRDIKPMCVYCVYAKAGLGENDILCQYQGVTTFNYSCHKYEYDPLKRVPKRHPAVKAPSAYNKTDV